MGISAKEEDCLPIKEKCPFQTDLETIQYFSYGIVPHKWNEIINVENWKFHYCANEYYTCGHMINYIDQDFFTNSGVFIGSSIDISTIDDKTMEKIDKSIQNKLKNYSKKKGEEAQSYLKDNPLKLSESEVDNINYVVYNTRLEEIKTAHQIPFPSTSIEQAILAFNVQYYSHPIVKELNILISNGQWSSLSYYISSMRGRNLQTKLVSLVLNSHTTGHNPYYHIGLLFDGKIKNLDNWTVEKKFFIELCVNLKTKFTIGDSAHFLLTNQLCDENVIKKIESYEYQTQKEEHLQATIDNFYEKFKEKRVYDNYYQNVLFIFLHDKLDDKTIDLSKLHDSKIFVYLIGICSDKLTIDYLKEIGHDDAKVIPIDDFAFLSEKQEEYLHLIEAVLSTQIEHFNFIKNEEEKLHVSITNIQALTDYTHKTFKLHAEPNTRYNIRLLYLDEEVPIDMNIYVSSTNPYPDVFDYSLLHFGLKVSDPILNYEASGPFYIAIFTNALNYSLEITKCHENDNCTIISNGLYDTLPVERQSNRYYSFEMCYQKKCSLSPFDLLSKYRRGIEYSYHDDSLSIYDMGFYFNWEIFNCLYSNYYCGYIPIKQRYKEDSLENSVFIGFNTKLSDFTEFKMHQELGLSKIMLNKFKPFLKNSHVNKNERKELENLNIKFSVEELKLIEKNEIKIVYQTLNKDIDCFEDLPKEVQFAIILNRFDRNKVIIEEMEYYLCYDYYVNRYIKKLFDPIEPPLDKDELYSRDFQVMLITSFSSTLTKKLMISIIVPKSMMSQSELAYFIERKELNDIMMSLSYYDNKKKKMILMKDFTYKLKDVNKDIFDFQSESDDNEMVDLDIILQQQIQLYRYYDYGFRKIILFFTNFYEENSTKGIIPPTNQIIAKVNNEGINIIHLTNEHLAIKDKNKIINSNWIEKNKKIYYDSISDFDDYVLLQEIMKIINIIPIPIMQIKPMIIDIQNKELVTYHFNLEMTTDDEDDYDGDESYNIRIIKFTFDNKNLDVYISRTFPYPSKYQYDYVFNGTTTDTNSFICEVEFELNKKQKKLVFYMSLSANEDIPYLIIDIEDCNGLGICEYDHIEKRIIISFLLIAVALFGYGLYNCFCDTINKIDTNIYERR